MLVKYYVGSYAINSSHVLEVSKNTKAAENRAAESVPVVLVENTADLDVLAQSWLDLDVLAVDTEFERRTTFYAKLALLQVYDGQSIYLIDPLKVECPNSLKNVFANNNIVKILHSCKEDIEVLFTEWGCEVAKLFDTQVAYHIVSDEASIGYARLVEEYTDVVLSKQQTQSDWVKRPLSAAQLKYAANDVLYLIFIYEKLKAKLEDLNLVELFETECDEIVKLSIDRAQLPADYREAKEVNLLSSNDLSLFKLLFDWREKVAREDNRTKNHIIKDQQLVQMAILKPTSKAALKGILELHPRSVRKYAESWIKIVESWKNSRPSPLPVVINPRDIAAIKPLVSEWEKLIKLVAKQQHIPASLIMSKRIMRKLAYAMITKSNPPAIWGGWRKNLLEESLVEKTKQFVNT
jgi:ribonuclease D